MKQRIVVQEEVFGRTISNRFLIIGRPCRTNAAHVKTQEENHSTSPCGLGGNFLKK